MKRSTDPELEQVLREMIMLRHSKDQRDLVINWVGSNQLRFDILVKFLLQNEPKLSQRAAWPTSYVAIAHPELAAIHLKNFILNLNKTSLHQAIKRNTLRLLEKMKVPESLQGLLMDCCFRFLEDPKETIAVKAFALGNLYHLSLQYPDILPEIKALIASQQDRLSPGLKVRARPFFSDIS